MAEVSSAEIDPRHGQSQSSIKVEAQPILPILAIHCPVLNLLP